MVNRVILIGNAGGDPEIRHLENGTAVGKFSLATNENYMGKDGQWQTNTEWHDIVVWRNLAEKAERDVKKGSMIYLEGKLTHRKWQDKDGNNRYTTEVVANYFRVLNKRDADGSGASGRFPAESDAPEQGSNPTGEKSVNNPTTAATGVQGNDDLPF